jgi:hypothetical protein
MERNPTQQTHPALFKNRAHLKGQPEGFFKPVIDIALGPFGLWVIIRVLNLA